jgi:hypothetical protein
MVAFSSAMTRTGLAVSSSSTPLDSVRIQSLDAIKPRHVM